jgi:leucyl/phenylalanyl-tRNA--protein transferase
VIPLDKLHIPSRVARYLRSGMYEVTFDREPAAVLAACGDRTETWLSSRLQEVYLQLFEMGALHSVETYEDGRLMGGAFGVAIGSIFTIESMFNHGNHSSKLAFAHLCQHLKDRGFTLADCQYQSPHVERFGAIEIPRNEYRDWVARGLIHPASFR